MTEDREQVRGEGNSGDETVLSGQPEGRGEEDAESRKPFYVVGIGASAGGFEALEKFFDNMSSTSGMAFVVVQHLSPDHKSLMAELLSKHTEMAVHQATEGVVLQPDHIYLIPPKKNMTVVNGKLHLADKAPKLTLNFPIDIFLNSLAEDRGEQVIAVILSGTGSDGTRGIRTVKEQGGIIMVQDLNSAKFDGMPSNAIATGLADYILPPDQMPHELLKYVQHPFIARPDHDATKLLQEQTNLERLFALLKNQSGVDFTHYKQSTVSRRIERRLSVNQVDKLEDYVNYLYQNPNEVRTLYKELLIGVTRFFRDPESFAVMERRVIPEIIRTKSKNAPIRVWVAGCSTGEEAYSLAILFRESMEKMGVMREVKVFATDVDSDALEFASVGQYPENIVADLTSERFHKYFVRKGDKYQVANQIREMVIFAQHNIIRDPPFNKIDLLSCRNLLIYLQPVLQKKVLMHFNFALVETGYMFLGSSETIGHFTNLFTPFDTKWKIYRSKGRQVPLTADSFSITPVHRRRQLDTVFDKVVPQQLDHRKEIAGIYESLLLRYIPPCAIVNRRHELIHVLGDVSEFLKIQPGNVSLNIGTLIRKELSIAVETGLNKAGRENQDVAYMDIRYEEGGETVRLDLRIIVYSNGTTDDELFLVIFDKRESPENEVGTKYEQICAGDEKFTQRIMDLEHDLQYTRENLQATIEELETTNEELQATNEELLSANEELQSANEELQSVNEELITVNSEYQSKIQELTELNNDMNNLLHSTNIGTIFLDKDLRIRKFTPAISREINLLDTDIGRPISHIVFNIDYDNILDDSRRVLNTLAPFEREVRSSEGKWLLLRILPYRTDDNIIKGVVITFVDTSSLKKATAELHKLSHAVELSPSIIVITDPQGDIEYVNKSFVAITGYAPEEVLGRNTRIFKTGMTPQEEYVALWEAVSVGESWSGVFTNRKRNREIYYEHATIVPIHDDKGRVEHLLKVAEDITERKKAQELLEHSRLRVLNILESTTDSYIELDVEWRFIYVNQKAEQLLGMDRRQLLGKQIWDVFPRTVQSVLFSTLHTARKTMENQVFDEYIPTFGAWLEFHVFPAEDTTAVYFRDITSRMLTESELRESEERFRSTFSQAAVGLAHVAPDCTLIRFNDRFCQILGKDCAALQNAPLDGQFAALDGGAIRRQLEMLISKRQGQFTLEASLAGRTDDEQSAWVVLTCSLLTDEQGAPKYAILVLEDISRRKIAELLQRHDHDMLQSIAATSPVSITVVNAQGRIVFANGQAEKLFGLRVAEIESRNFNAPEWRITDLEGSPFPEERLPFVRVMREKRPVYGVRHAIEDDGGRRILLEINAAPLFDATGEVTAVVNAIQDISTELATQTELREHRERLEELVSRRTEELRTLTEYLDSLDVLFVGLDKDGRIQIINRRGCELFGKREKELLGADWFVTALPERSRAEVRGVFRRLMAGEVDPLEHYISPVVDKDGREVDVDWHNKLVRDASGGIRGTLSSGRIKSVTT